MKQLKAAFCFSGQLRTWKDCYPTWKKLMDQFDTPPDIFCHIWDFNSNTGRIDSLTKETHIEKVSPEEIQSYLDTLKPAKYIIEGQDKSYEVNLFTHMKIQSLLQNKDIQNSIFWAGSQFYGIMYSSFLKREFEMENNFEYDVCFRLRNDLFFSDADIEILFNRSIKLNNMFIPITIINDNTIYSVHSSTSYDWPYVNIGDIFFFGNSQTYDNFSLFYYRLPDIFVKSFKCKLLKPESYLFFYLKSLLYHHIPLVCDPKIMRDKNYKETLIKYNEPLYNCDKVKDDV